MQICHKSFLILFPFSGYSPTPPYQSFVRQNIMENLVAKQLEALLKLQSIDSKLDEIEKMRGDLPEEVRDLEDEIIGFNTRIGRFNEELNNLNESIVHNKLLIKDAEKLIEKYETQQNNVRNNREYDAISKEIELQQLEIQILNKKMREALAKIEIKEKQIEDTEATLAARNRDLANKQKELDQLIAESGEDEEKLQKERERRVKNIESRLYKSYQKIRGNAQNGLAVVMVKRDACGGCFNIVPPQRQADIREKKKIIVCEHCGRVFADVEETVVVEKVKKPTKKRGAAAVVEEKTEAMDAGLTPTEELL